MTDLETLLRRSFQDELGPVTASPSTTEAATQSGKRAARRRTVSTGLAALTVLAVIAGASTLVPHGGRPSPVARSVRTIAAAEHVVDLVGKGSIDEAHAYFSPTFSKQLSSTGLERLWHSVVVDQLGGYGGGMSIGGARDADVGRTYSAHVATQSRKDAFVQLDVDNQGLITSFFVRPLADSPDQTVMIARAYATGSFTYTDLSLAPSVANALHSNEIAKVWQLAEDDGGALIEIGSPRRDGTTTLLPLTFDHSHAQLAVTYSAEQIVGLSILRTDPALDPTSRAVLADLTAGRFAAVRARFDSTMLSQFSELQLKQAWQSVAVDEHGGVDHVISITTPLLHGTRVQRVLCQMRIGQLIVQIAYDSQTHISGLYLTHP